MKMFEQEWRQWATGGWGYFFAPWESRCGIGWQLPSFLMKIPSFLKGGTPNDGEVGSIDKLVWREKLSEARCGVRFPQSEVSVVESCPLGRVGGAGGMAAEKEGYRTEGQTKERHIFNLSCQRSEYLLTFSFECLKEFMSHGLSAHCSVMFECTLCCGHTCEWMLRR